MNFSRALLPAARRIVIKVGTRLVSDPGAGLDMIFLDRLARQVARLQDRGCQVIIVTSGSVHLGRTALGYRPDKETLTYRQAAAAIGQPELMRSYSEALGSHRLLTGQLLLTMDDMTDRRRYLNTRNTLELLLQRHVVPVINENDTVSVEGVTFVENDKLAALVATKLQADLLIYLSDQPGLMTEHPSVDPDAQVISEVQPGQVLSASIGASGGPESRGGMQAKVKSARKAAGLGIPVVMASGREENVIIQVCEGKPVGTLFVPSARMAARRLWLATAAEPAGEVHVDAGAARVLTQPDGASLLPVGVVGAEGEFEAGDTVSIIGPDGVEIARGLVNYTAAEVRAIAGVHSQDLAEILGHVGHDEVIHRDNLVVLAG